MSYAVIKRLRAAGFEVKQRKDWGSEHLMVYAERKRSKPVDFPVSYLFAHITVTNKHGDEGARFVEQIGFERFFSGISYNWLVDHKDHTIYEGMPLDAKGTHTVNDLKVPGYPENLNYFGHAVAFVGMPGNKFCKRCAEMFAAIGAAEKLEGILRPEAEFLPHSMFAKKDCPTAAIRDRLPAINARMNRMVKEQLASQECCAKCECRYCDCGSDEK